MQPDPGSRQRLRWPVRGVELGGRSRTLPCMASRPRVQAETTVARAWRGVSWGVGLGRCHATRPREQAETAVAP